MAFKFDTVNSLANDRSVLQTYNTLSGKEKLSDNFYVVPNENKDEFVKSMKDKESRLKKIIIAGILLGGGLIPLLIVKNASIKTKLEPEVLAVSSVVGALLGSIPAVILDNKLTKKILQNCNAEKM